MTARLFVAIRVPPDLGGAVARHTGPLRGIDGVRWVAPGQLHLTLRFIGEVGADRMGAIAAAIDRELGPLPPFRMSLESAGAFPSTRRARVVWIGVRPTPALDDVHRAVERAVVEAGLPPEARAFRPHITLGRVGRGRAPDGLTRAIEEVRVEESFEVDRVYLMRSRLGRGGARHTVVADTGLRGAAAAGPVAPEGARLTPGRGPRSPDAGPRST